MSTKSTIRDRPEPESKPFVSLPFVRVLFDSCVRQESHVREVDAIAVAPPRVVVQINVLELRTPVESAVFQRDQPVSGQPQLGKVGRSGELVGRQMRYPAVAEVQVGQARRVQTTG